MPLALVASGGPPAEPPPNALRPVMQEIGVRAVRDHPCLSGTY